jgi:hypothetical protein
MRGCLKNSGLILQKERYNNYLSEIALFRMGSFKAISETPMRFEANFSDFLNHDQRFDRIQRHRRVALWLEKYRTAALRTIEYQARASTQRISTRTVSSPRSLYRPRDGYFSVLVPKSCLEKVRVLSVLARKSTSTEKTVLRKYGYFRAKYFLARAMPVPVLAEFS